MAAEVRIHLLTPGGMKQEHVEIDVGKGLRLDKLLKRLDKLGAVEKGFFKSVLKGRQGVTILLNNESFDPSGLKKATIRDGDKLSVLSPITGG